METFLTFFYEWFHRDLWDFLLLKFKEMFSIEETMEEFSMLFFMILSLDFL
jgi:hypothetical protein